MLQTYFSRYYFDDHIPQREFFWGVTYPMSCRVPTNKLANFKILKSMVILTSKFDKNFPKKIVLYIHIQLHNSSLVLNKNKYKSKKILK